MYTKTSNLLAIVVVVVFLTLAACSPAGDAPTATPVVSGVFADAWSNLLQQTPYPYTTPLPPAETTSVDGDYTKF
ncbi:MAG: hypothetical protein V3S01_11795, partial [Dehalococcoidia bacterium]